MASSSVYIKVKELGEALVKAADDGNINEVTRLLGKKADINYAHRWIVDGVNMSKTPLIAAELGGQTGGQVSDHSKGKCEPCRAMRWNHSPSWSVIDKKFPHD